jgi:hypothetical protein
MLIEMKIIHYAKPPRPLLMGLGGFCIQRKEKAIELVAFVGKTGSRYS